MPGERRTGDLRRADASSRPGAVLSRVASPEVQLHAAGGRPHGDALRAGTGGPRAVLGVGDGRRPRTALTTGTTEPSARWRRSRRGASDDLEFAPKTRSAGTSAGALTELTRECVPARLARRGRGPRAAAGAVPAVDVPAEPPAPAGTRVDAGDEGRFLPARLKNETNETNAQTADRRLVGTAELERVIDANANGRRTSCSIIRTETERPMLPDRRRRSNASNERRLASTRRALYGESVRAQRAPSIVAYNRPFERRCGAWARAMRALAPPPLTAFAETREASRSDLAMRA